MVVNRTLFTVLKDEMTHARKFPDRLVHLPSPSRRRQRLPVEQAHRHKKYSYSERTQGPKNHLGPAHLNARRQNSREANPAISQPLLRLDGDTERRREPRAAHVGALCEDRSVGTLNAAI